MHNDQAQIIISKFFLVKNKWEYNDNTKQSWLTVTEITKQHCYDGNYANNLLNLPGVCK